MLLDPEDEKEFRRKQGVEGLGDYDAVILRLGLGLSQMQDFPPAQPETYGLESLSGLGIYKGVRRGKEILFASTMAGASTASLGIEMYLCHSPATEGIGIGYCGGLRRGIAVGSIIIPSMTRIGEGTSKYYGKSEFSTPDHDLVKRLVDATRRFGYEPLVGEIYSTDAPFMETPDFIAKLSRQGILGIDMEMSALFSIAAFHSKKAAGIFVVSDNPAEDSALDPASLISNIMSNLQGITQDVFKICIEALAG